MKAIRAKLEPWLGRPQWKQSAGRVALYYIAVMHLARASWSTASRRVPEAMAMSIPVGAALMGRRWDGLETPEGM